MKSTFKLEKITLYLGDNKFISAYKDGFGRLYIDNKTCSEYCCPHARHITFWGTYCEYVPIETQTTRCNMFHFKDCKVYKTDGREGIEELL